MTQLLRSCATTIHLDTALAKENALKASEKLIKQAMKQMSEPAANALQRVWELLMELIPRLDRFDANARIVHDVEQTATRHLPELIEPYLALPAAYARFHHIKDNKTARDHLIEQLQVLEEALKSALHDALNEDVDQLRIQGEFLRKTFSQGLVTNSELVDVSDLGQHHDVLKIRTSKTT